MRWHSAKYLNAQKWTYYMCIYHHIVAHPYIQMSIFVIRHCSWLILTNGAPPPPIHAHCTTVYAILILINIHTHFIIFIFSILNLKFIILHSKLLKLYQAAQIISFTYENKLQCWHIIDNTCRSSKELVICLILERW